MNPEKPTSSQPSASRSTRALDIPLRTPPPFCQYANGPCDQVFTDIPTSDVLFLYASQPSPIAAAIRAALDEARRGGLGAQWRSWEDLPISGQIIFCEVCKAMRYSSTVVADVTTLNFNLLFEIGFAIGLGLPIIPIRDTTYTLDRKAFEELDILQTLGYVDFTNGHHLLEALTPALPGRPLPAVDEAIAIDAPLYVVNGPVDTEGTVQLLSAVKKSRVKFRTYDPSEMARLSLSEARKQVARSLGVFAHLLSPNRTGSRVHNALCALVSGLAMAQGKTVLMLNEENTRQPIDYRDMVKSYSIPRQIVGLIEEPILSIYDEIQRKARGPRFRPKELLQRLDLGDIAAENEIAGLDGYFVETGQYVQARQGHARLVVGRKGSGKTAIFYGIRDPLIGTPSRLLLDLRPEGHQFTRLREFVLQHFVQGLQEHTMIAFWHYLLLCEMARKILVGERAISRRDPNRYAHYLRVEEVYARHTPDFEADFSQRLLVQVDAIIERLGGIPLDAVGGRLTELIFGGKDLSELEDCVTTYLQEKEEVWLLIDNLDKSWPTHGSTSEDILILRALLEASRRLQHRLEDEQVSFRCLVFLRTDIWEHLLRETPDKGKDTAISLEWEDVSMFEEIVRRRIETSTDLRGGFGEIWSALCESHIKVQDTFDYLVERTLMRPRDLLLFLRRCLEVAINRDHDKIQIEDILTAERSYSEDMLLATAYEIGDTHPRWQDLLYVFQGGPRRLGVEELRAYLQRAGVADVEADEAIEFLLRFGFLGVSSVDFSGDLYYHTVHSNLRRLLDPVARGRGQFVIHPAFGEALDLKT